MHRSSSENWHLKKFECLNYFLLPFECICVFMFIYLCTSGVCAHVYVDTCLYVEARGGQEVSCPISVYLSSLRFSLSLNLELGLWPGHSPVSVFHSPGVTDARDQNHTQIYVDVGNLSSGSEPPAELSLQPTCLNS